MEKRSAEGTRSRLIENYSFFASKQDELNQIMEIVKQSFDAQAE